MNKLKHYGVLGMKWGKRKNRENVGSKFSEILRNSKKSRREHNDKLKKIKEHLEEELKSDAPENRYIGDYKRISYRSKPLAIRYSKMVGASLTNRLLASYIKDKDLSRYTRMSKTELLKEVRSIALEAAANTFIKDRLADSSAKNYDENGRLKKGIKEKAIVTKQDAVEVAVSTLTYMIPMWSRLIKWDLSRKESENKERFESWGERILSSKVPNIVWRADDFSMDIIDER